MALLFAKNNSLSAVTALPAAVSGGGFNLISTQTASSSSSIEFTSGLDSTYKEYIFKFFDIHGSTVNKHFSVNFRDGGSSFDATKTTTYLKIRHGEDASLGSLGYDGGNDLEQSTSDQKLHENCNIDNDSCLAGTLHLFDPSNTTFTKFFFSNINSVANPPISDQVLVSGYCNTTVAIDGVKFSFSSGTIDAGTIKMYGVT